MAYSSSYGKAGRERGSTQQLLLGDVNVDMVARREEGAMRSFSEGRFDQS